MKTILHIIDTTGPGGAETVFIELAAALNPEQYRSIALVRGPGWLKDQLEARGVELYVENCKGSFNIRFLLFLRKLIRDKNIDLIHTHLLGSAVYGCLAGWLCRRPVVNTFHGSVDVSSQERFLKTKFGIINAITTKVIFVSEKLQKSFEANVKLTADKCAVILNGTRKPRVIGDKQGSRNAVGLPQDKIVLGALGNVRAAKAYPVFVEAVSVLHRRGFEVHAAIAGQGDGPLLEELETLINKLALTQHFSLLGFVRDTDKFLDAIDVYVVSSSSEGHPLALTQAMMAGLPIVVTRCGVEEIVEEGKEAVVVEKNSPAKLAEGIAVILNNDDQAAAMGASSREKAIKYFGLDKMIEQYEQTYTNALEGSGCAERLSSIP